MPYCHGARALQPRRDGRRGCVLLRILIAKPEPYTADSLSPRCPARRQACNLSKRRIKLKCFSHGNDSPVLRRVCRATNKPPRVVVGVMCHAENRKPLLNDLPCCDGRDMGCLVKWPVIWHNVQTSATGPGRGVDGNRSARQMGNSFWYAFAHRDEDGGEHRPTSRRDYTSTESS
jgi:hypothetical protein